MFRGCKPIGLKVEFLTLFTSHGRFKNKYESARQCVSKPAGHQVGNIRYGDMMGNVLDLESLKDRVQDSVAAYDFGRLLNFSKFSFVKQIC